MYETCRIHAVEVVGLTLTEDKRLTGLCCALIDDSVEGLQMTIQSVTCCAEKMGL